MRWQSCDHRGGERRDAPTNVWEGRQRQQPPTLRPSEPWDQGREFQQSIPILRIFDVAKATEFYVGFLGFTVDWEHRFGEGFPLYMQVSREGCVIHLSEHHGDACPGATLRIETGPLDAGKPP